MYVTTPNWWQSLGRAKEGVGREGGREGEECQIFS